MPAAVEVAAVAAAAALRHVGGGAAAVAVGEELRKSMSNDVSFVAAVRGEGRHGKGCIHVCVQTRVRRRTMFTTLNQ